MEMEKSQLNFCDQCRVFDIRLSSFMRESVGESPATRDIYVGTPKEMGERGYCQLCRLLFRACRDGPLRHLFLEFDESSDKQAEHYPVKLAGAWQAMYLSFWPALYATQVNVRIVVRPLSPETESHPSFARSITSPFLDINLIKRWMRKCEIDHVGSPCDEKTWSSIKPNTGPLGGTGCNFHTIDVFDYCIIQHDESCRYVALSYCWGPQAQLLLTKEKVGSLKRFGGLRGYASQIPATIMDAVVLTARLGERYLWVDSLCIIQDEEASRNTTIENMHKIYLQASLVIIAGDGSRASDGLAGVQSPRKANQFMDTCGPGPDLCAQFDVKDYLSQSHYSTRGWTFQEHRLARRALIFINNQIYFSCLSGTFSEDIITEDCAKPDQLMHSAADSLRTIRRSRDFVAQYRQSVNSYTSRTLGVASDINRAFQGILNVLTERLNSSYLGTTDPSSTSVEGIPRSIFDVGLLWQPKRILQYRHSFPSWSWTGWFGEVHWYNDGLVAASNDAGSKGEKEIINRWLAKRTWIDWNFDHQRGSSNDTPIWNADEPVGELSDSIESIEPQKKRTSPWGNQKSPSERYGWLLPSNSRFLGLPEIRYQSVVNTDHTHTCLHFWTASACFVIRPIFIGPIRYRASDPEELGAGLVVFLLVNRHDQPCGYVLLDERWMSEAESEQEFIMLSEAEYYMDYTRPHHAHPYPEVSHEGDDYLEYHAMMIVWENGLAKRVGLGRVMKAALGDACAGPEVRLG